MSSSNPSWFPTPPPKPLKAPSAAKLIFGTIVPAVAVVGAIVSMSTLGHSGHKAKAATPAVTSAATDTQDRRAAFRDCMRSAGAGSGSRGRFGGRGPSKGFREAFAICRSLLQSTPSGPLAPARTGTTAPVA